MSVFVKLRRSTRYSKEWQVRSVTNPCAPGRAFRQVCAGRHGGTRFPRNGPCDRPPERRARLGATPEHAVQRLMTNDDIGKADLAAQVVVVVDDRLLVRACAEGLLRPRSHKNAARNLGGVTL